MSSHAAGPKLRDDEGIERLFHIARVPDWEQAQRHGVYRVSSLGTLLDDVGFIHLSFAHQVEPVADAVYRGMTDLVLLEVDPRRLDAPVVIESLYPHLYGEIQLQAVALVRPYQPRPDGTFDPVS
jgi:glutathione S-transferase